MKPPRPLHTGDLIRLASPGYGEPEGDCVVIANQQGPLVWFTSITGGAAFVARREAVRKINQVPKPKP